MWSLTFPTSGRCSHWQSQLLVSVIIDSLKYSPVWSLTVSTTRQCDHWQSQLLASVIIDSLNYSPVWSLTVSTTRQCDHWQSQLLVSVIIDSLNYSSVWSLTVSTTRQCDHWQSQLLVCVVIGLVVSYKIARKIRYGHCDKGISKLPRFAVFCYKRVYFIPKPDQLMQRFNIAFFIYIKSLLKNMNYRYIKDTFGEEFLLVLNRSVLNMCLISQKYDCVIEQNTMRWWCA